MIKIRFHQIEDFMIDLKIDLQNISFVKVTESRMQTSLGGYLNYDYIAAEIKHEETIFTLKPLSYKYQNLEECAILLCDKIIIIDKVYLKILSKCNFETEAEALVYLQAAKQLGQKLCHDFLLGARKKTNISGLLKGNYDK